MKKFLKILLIIVLIVLGIIFIFPLFARFITDILWWKSLGYLSVYFKLILIKGFSFIVPFLFVYAVLNIWFFGMRKTLGSTLLKVIIWIVAIAAGVWGEINWQYFLVNLSVSQTGFADPVFGIDTFFYMFRLPLLRMALMILSGMFVILFVLDLFAQKKQNKPVVREGRIYLDASNRILFVINIIFVLALLFTGLMEKLVSQPDLKLGVGFQDIKGGFIGTYIFMGVVLLYGIAVFFRSRKGLKFGKVILQAVSITVFYVLLIWAYPFILNKVWVEPNQLMVQEPYIVNRIESTRQGFNLVLDDYTLISGEEADIAETIYKTRIWDSDPYKDVIKQFQEVKTYFDFVDVDVSKYTLSNGVFQVVVSARELNVNNLSLDAMTWDNLHLRYTHGYGATLSPANQVDEDGGPIFWVRNLENITPFDELRLDYPQIYYGELTSNYIFVKTEAEEFEYTTDTNRVTTVYEFNDGVALKNIFRRILYSVIFKDKMVVLTRYFNRDTKVLYRRLIQDRVRYIFPFLEYDDDPYITIVDGKLYWIMDAFTFSDRYPLSQRYETDYGELNYIRNPVKVVVDAYRGDVKFYVTDNQDPIIESYRNIFPELFLDTAPPELEQHFRYPDSMFKIQAEVLTTYHVDSFESFYNGEDVWKIPEQTYGSEKVPFEPYYLLTKMEDEYQFSLIEPYNPVSKENLSSWLIAYYDDGPRLTLKYVDKTSVSLGPVQVEALINQDETMSQLFSLWGQMGSEVFRGNIQFIPLTNGVLYLEPILLKAEEIGIPQIATIVAVMGNDVFYGDDFEQLLLKILSVTDDEIVYGSQMEEIEARTQDLYINYLKAEEKRVSGDINGYEESVDTIGRDLKELLEIIKQE